MRFCRAHPFGRENFDFGHQLLDLDLHLGLLLDDRLLRSGDGLDLGLELHHGLLVLGLQSVDGHLGLGVHVLSKKILKGLLQKRFLKCYVPRVACEAWPSRPRAYG